MIINKNKQSGIMLMELIFASFILAIFLAAIAMFMQRQERLLKNKASGSYINDVMEATREYIKDHTDDIISAVSGDEFENIDLQADLIDNGYLSDGFGNHSPYGEDAEIAVIDKNNRFHIIVLLPNNDVSTEVSDAEIAASVPNGNGGVYFSSAAASNPCGGVDCLQGIFGLWQYSISGPDALAFPTTLGAATPPDSLAVAYYKMEDGFSPFLSRNAIHGNLLANTMNTDLNINEIADASSDPVNPDTINPAAIIFNKGDDIADYDTDGNPTNYAAKLEYQKSIYDPALTDTALYQDPSLILSSDGSLGDVNGAGLTQHPMLSSDGGLSTGLNLVRADVDDDGDGTIDRFGYPLCSQKGHIALEEDKEFLQCIGTSWVSFTRDSIVYVDSLLDVPLSASSVIVLATAQGSPAVGKNSSHWVIVNRAWVSPLPGNGISIPTLGFGSSIIIGYIE